MLKITGLQHLLNSVLFNNHVDIAELLIRHQADINAQSKIHGTSLHVAAEQGHYEMAELLIRHHADVNVLCFATPFIRP